ncbi:acyl-coenzyme A thioesterase 13-like [Pollicipes pollicipes]|uniref:acyl-coenzyme A thioesterase 13-like n=1 Tax=Pollicipes pollicipes TaxID=41117 RepID=UPI001884E217|nr:acyl-coenzyme A thioesterase 13-like [Pollicipes pollicipes]
MAPNVVVVAAEPGQLKAQFTVAEEHLNAGGTLHGGYTAYLVDVLSTAALMTVPPNLAGVSVDLSVAYMKAAKAGDVVTVDALTLKVGRQLGFSSVDLRNDAGQLLAQGKHTKFLI